MIISSTWTCQLLCPNWTEQIPSPIATVPFTDFGGAKFQSNRSSNAVNSANLCKQSPLQLMSALPGCRRVSSRPCLSYFIYLFFFFNSKPSLKFHSFFFVFSSQLSSTTRKCCHRAPLRIIAQTPASPGFCHPSYLLFYLFFLSQLDHVFFARGPHSSRK